MSIPRSLEDAAQDVIRDAFEVALARRRAEQATLTVEEAARMLGIGRGTAYAAVRRGEIPAWRISRRWVLSKDALEEMLKSGGRPSAAGQRDGDEAR